MRRERRAAQPCGDDARAGARGRSAALTPILALFAIDLGAHMRVCHGQVFEN